MDVKDIILSDARIIFRNLSGKPDKFNAQGGARKFGVVLPPELADQLVKEGWNVKYLKPREEGEEPTPWLDVKVNYANRPPKIYLITNKSKRLLNENTVGEIDYAEIKTVDVVINPSHWTMGGKEGIAAYVKEMYVTIQESYFSDKYSFEEPVPFN